MRKFPIKYRVEFGDHPVDSLKSEGFAGCDEMILCTVVRFPDGKGTIAVHSTNGKPNENMKTTTMFSAWLALAAKVAAQEDLNNVQREVLLNALNSSKTKTEKL